MLVFVINNQGKSLMPCEQSKARKLLKEKKAKIISYKPFTIQLLFGSSGYTQKVNIGIDVGAKYVGVAIQSQNKVIANGVDYQQGETFGYYDARYYVFDRDNDTCQVCKKSKDKIFNTHHIIYRSKGGSDRVSNLITVCTDCHTNENHQEGEILWRWMKDKKKVPQYKEAPFMNSLRIRIFRKYPNANIVYGSWTTPRRKELGLEKRSVVYMKLLQEKEEKNLIEKQSNYITIPIKVISK